MFLLCVSNKFLWAQWKLEGHCPESLSRLRAWVHSYKILAKRVEWNALNTLTVQFTAAITSGWANVSSHSSRAEMACSWDRGYPGLILWILLNYWECALSTQTSFVINNVAVILQLLGQQTRACVSHYDQSAWPSSKLCTLCKHRCAAASAHIRCCQINKRNGKLRSSKLK